MIVSQSGIHSIIVRVAYYKKFEFFPEATRAMTRKWNSILWARFSESSLKEIYLFDFSSTTL